MAETAKGRISLLSFDLDGTLLRRDGDIGPETLAAIRRAEERGVKLTIASGRVPAMAGLYLARLGIGGPYVAANGALVLRDGEGHRLAENPLEPGELEALTEFCREESLHYCLQAERTLLFTRDNPRTAVAERYNALALQYGSVPADIRHVALGSRGEGTPVYKVILQPPAGERAEALERYLMGRQRLTYTFSEAGLFDVTAAGTDKGRGIALVAQYYGIPLEQVCAFGDYDNDLSIFRRVGVTVAMANASPRLARAAMYHTAANDQEGIARAIEVLWHRF